MNKSKPRSKSEAQIEQTCSEYLALDGWRRVITDPKQLRGLAVTEKGIPDGLYIRYDDFIGSDGSIPNAYVLWVEFKSKRGRLSDAQLAWHMAERTRGALTVIAGKDFEPTVEGFQMWYRKSGLRRQVR